MKAGRLPKLPSIERLLSKAGARTALQARDPALVEAVYEHWLQRRKADKAGGGRGGRWCSTSASRSHGRWGLRRQAWGIGGRVKGEASFTLTYT